MPTVKTDDGIDIRYRIDGADGSRPLILSNSLGTNLTMWDAQVAAFSASRRLVRYDQRGHGGSSAPAGSYAMERLGRDVIALMDALGLATADFCGISMGGMTGMWLGANEGGRFGRLVLSNTSAHMPDKAPWESRIAAVRAGGMRAIEAAVLERWFTPAFREANPDEADRVLAMIRATDPAGYVGCCAAVRDMDHRALLARIALATLVVIGGHDAATPPEAGRAIAAAVPGARLVELDAAHLSNIEQPRRFTEAVLAFLDQ